MAEVTELLRVLRELGALGWPVQVNEFKRSATVILGDDRDPAPTYEIFLNLYAGTSWTIAATLIPGESAEDLIAGYLEREVERRGLWMDYVEALAENMTPESFLRRPTLFETARAVLEVAKEGENG